MLPEDKKLVGYDQESDRAWVLENSDSGNNELYSYIGKLKNGSVGPVPGYNDRELLYMYPATKLSADIIYYTDSAMTVLTSVYQGAKKDGGVPNKVGTYYRKAIFEGGTEKGITYASTEVSSPFYVVDELSGGTRRGFGLSLVQPNYKTPNGIPRGVDKPFASVDEGWSWTPASGENPAKLVLKNFKQEWAWKGIPIAQRAAAFTAGGGTDPTLNNDMKMQILLMKSLFKKVHELGGKLILPGFEQVEIELIGTNQIKSHFFSGVNYSAGIYVCNYEVAPLNALLQLLGAKTVDGYTKNLAVNILGMEDKSLLLAGNGTLDIAGSITSPAGISVGDNVKLDVTGGLETRLIGVAARNESESALSAYTYTGSTKNPTDVSVNLQGRVNIEYKDDYGIYSTGKISADGANLTVKSSRKSGQLGNTAGLGAAYGVNIKNSTITISGESGEQSAGGAISAAEQLSITDSNLTTSGYDYGLSVFGLYQTDGVPASLKLKGGTTDISAVHVAVYASDDVIIQDSDNTDGVNVSIENFLGILTGENQAVYAYTKNDSNPTRTLEFSASPRANRITPYGVTVGTMLDSGKTVATLLENSDIATKSVSAFHIPSGNNRPIDEEEPVDDKKPVEPAEINFDDVSKDAWYYNAIQYVAQKKLLIGITDTEFAPSLPMDRAMMITLLYRMANEPVVEGTIPFNDVNMSAYYGNALIWAYQNNIANGDTDSTFAPSSAITRQDLAVLFYRYGNSSVGSTDVLSDFADVSDMSAYAMDAMAWAVKNGIIQGDNQKKLNPKDKATRAQCAAMIQRYENLKATS